MDTVPLRRLERRFDARLGVYAINTGTGAELAYTPGGPRDTTHPRALATDYRMIVLGGALPPAKRAFLRDLLQRNTTGDNRIRAGLPGWTLAD